MKRETWSGRVGGREGERERERDNVHELITSCLEDGDARMPKA